MSPELFTGCYTFRPCIFFDTEEEARQALEDIEQAKDRREQEEAARAGTLALFGEET